MNTTIEDKNFYSRPEVAGRRYGAFYNTLMRVLILILISLNLLISSCMPLNESKLNDQDFKFTVEFYPAFD